MHSLMTAEDLRLYCKETWSYCWALASWWEEQIPQQTARLYRVPEWDYAADIIHTQGIGR